ncbi:hypothetical protein M2271_001458 [Streptomyces sp. LBL]|uniref:hypothetical protein n=1 Tax=Streptomyces sp. LBL TaxID=2940562 RepID=UPI002473978B|nr:hypothetical protein [Streptomyces sp. LBL]MDH6623666.1 hypothetical protein [Streptomyces sp. LBL]
MAVAGAVFVGVVQPVAFAPSATAAESTAAVTAGKHAVTAGKHAVTAGKDVVAAGKRAPESAATPQAAQEAAEAGGSDVEITSLRSESGEVYATPDGQLEEV